MKLSWGKSIAKAGGWNGSLSVGIPIIDEDHKGFFEVAEDIRRIQRFGFVSPETIDSALLILREYVDAHFSREEAVLKTGPYHEYVLHKREHDFFARRIEKTTDKFRGGDYSVIDELADTVENWIVDHIKKWDCLYQSWVTPKDVDPRAMGVLLSARSRF